MELARAAEVSPITLREFENGKSPLHQGVRLILRTVLERAGIDFAPDGSVSRRS